MKGSTKPSREASKTSAQQPGYGPYNPKKRSAAIGQTKTQQARKSSTAGYSKQTVGSPIKKSIELGSGGINVYQAKTNIVTARDSQGSQGSYPGQQARSNDMHQADARASDDASMLIRGIQTI